MQTNPQPTKRTTSGRQIAFLIAGIAIGGMAVAFRTQFADAKTAKPKVEVLLSTEKTIIGQPIAYPTGRPAKVTAVIVTMEPGQETGWHEHEVPLYGRVLEGELTVDYGPHGKRVYKTGDSLMEALRAPHNGRNTGKGPMRVLAVLMGADGYANSKPVAPPNSK